VSAVPDSKANGDFFAGVPPRADSPVRKGLPDFSFGVGVDGETVSGAGLDVSFAAPGTTAGVVSVAGTGVVSPGEGLPGAPGS
jgi:hypothetical protein